VEEAHARLDREKAEYARLKRMVADGDILEEAER